MKKKGFTLIELLAVIVILAIIALIATPIVINIISDAKKSSQEESIKMYAKAIEDGVANYLLRNPNKKEVPTIEELQEGKYINYKGNVYCEETKIYPNGKIYLDKCTVDGTQVTYTYGEKEKTLCTLDGEKTGTEEINIGDKYKCEVKPGTTYTFYVLSKKDDKVNLIMNSNICNDGTLADKDHQCNYAWHWQTQEWDEYDNNYGPDIAMTNLYNATKSWINVPDMIMNYEDENNKTDTTLGYTGITTDTTTKTTTITGKQNKTSTSQIFGNTTEPLKARLPREDEVTSQEAGCEEYTDETCSAWLVEDLDDGGYSKYSTVPKTENIYGYWLLSSYPGYSDYARTVDYYGRVGVDGTSYASYYGLRAVITVSKSDLS